VIADPDRVESGILRGSRDRGNLLPADLALDLRELDPYAHWHDDIVAKRMM
jgi:hypothetical protein